MLWSRLLQHTTIEIKLTPKFATAEILVSDSSGPIGDASISIGPYQLSTNNQGSALFYNKPARAEYTLRIEKEGYIPLLDTIWFEIDTTLLYTLTLMTNIEVIEAGSITIFPNPADDFINILSSGQIKSASVRNMLGQYLIHGEQKLQNKTVRIDISQLVAGIYLLITETIEDNIYRNVFIKK